MKATDNRMNITSRAFNMIKIIKLYSWERLFKRKIDEKRKIEVEIGKKKLSVQVVVNAIYWVLETALCMSCIIFFNLFYGQMEVDKILTGFFVIEDFFEPLFSLPDFFICLFEAIVSMHRIQDFLAIKDHDGEQIEYFTDKKQPYSIDISHVDFGVEKTYGNEEKNEDKEENEEKNNEKDKKDIKDNKLFPKELESMDNNNENEDENENDNDKEHLILSSDFDKGLINEENNNSNSNNGNKEIRTKK